MSVINYCIYVIFAFISTTLPEFNGIYPWTISPIQSRFQWYTILLINRTLANLFFCETAELSKNLHYYESIHADEVVHRIVKRGAKQSVHPFNVIEEVEFKVLGRHFRIILHPQRDVLHNNFKAYSVDADGNEKVVHFGQYQFEWKRFGLF